MLEPNGSAGLAPRNRKMRRAAERRARKRLKPGQRGAGPSSSAAGTPALAALHREAGVHHDAGRLQQAERCYREMLLQDEQCAAAWFGIGLLATRMEKHDVAFDYYKKAVTIESGNAAYWIQLGECLTKLGHLTAATIAYSNAVDINPNDVELLARAGWAFYLGGKSMQALSTYNRALEIEPRYAPAVFGLGEQYYSLGQRELARKWFLKALDIDPMSREALFHLVEVIDEPDELDALVKRAERAASRTDDGEIAARYHFAAGKGYRRQKRYDEAFGHFAAGNGYLQQINPFSRDRFRRMVDERIDTFTPGLFDSYVGAADETRLPVFVVGMPRSGSTLIEQIISSHPDAVDAGEFNKFATIADLLSSEAPGELRYPVDMASFDPAHLAELGQDYLLALRYERDASAARITDKMLSNFLHIGLIHIMFPNAAIIHCRRDPMDSCLSCYFQMFTANKELSQTTDLSHLGFYYRHYERLMRHWHMVLPGRILDVQYEEMVANQEEMSRKLIECVGLPWDNACLKFYETKRSVRTASRAQVTRPVYTSSVKGWRKYEKHLGPLREALAADA